MPVCIICIINKAYIFTQHNGLTFLIEAHCVLCDVKTEFIYMLCSYVVNFILLSESHIRLSTYLLCHFHNCMNSWSTGPHQTVQSWLLSGTFEREITALLHIFLKICEEQELQPDSDICSFIGLLFYLTNVICHFLSAGSSCYCN